MNTYVILRGSIYVVLAMLASFSGWLDELTPERIGTLTWADWGAVISATLSGGLIALRSYIDGSCQRVRDSQIENEKKDPTTSA